MLNSKKDAAPATDHLRVYHPVWRVVQLQGRAIVLPEVFCKLVPEVFASLLVRVGLLPYTTVLLLH